MKKVSIIIVSWNGLHHLQKCLPSLLKQQFKNTEIILVDNASADGTVAFVESNYSDVKVIKNTSNLGFAEANNVGIEHARGEYILFLNNDTVVTKDFVVNLVSVMESDSEIGILQSKIYLLDNTKLLDSVGAFLTHTGLLYHFGIAKPDQQIYSRQIDVFSAKGACMMIRKSVLDAVLVEDKLFDPDYFAYFEETDVCTRVWLAGFRVTFTPKSVIYHKMGGTSTAMKTAFVQFHSHKNRINSYLKNLSLSSIMLILPLHLVFIELFAVVSLLQLRVGVFLAVQKAVWWNIANMQNTLRKRSIIQGTIRKVADSQFLPKVLKNPRITYYPYLFLGLQKYTD